MPHMLPRLRPKCHRMSLDQPGRKKGRKPYGIRDFRPSLDFVRLQFGGAEEDRTPDLRIANATLSQLSYRPTTNRF